MAKKRKQGELRESAQKIWYAGLGALATAEQEGGKAFKNLVSKGKKYERSLKKPVARARKKVSGTVDDVRDKAGKTWKRVEGALDKQVEAALHRIGVPTRKELADLTRKVEALTRKVGGGSKKKTGTARKTTTRKKTTARKKVARKTAS